MTGSVSGGSQGGISWKKQWKVSGARCGIRRFPLKINCVPLGEQDQDVCAVAEIARKYPVHVRFIEMMPIGCGEEFPGMTEDELRNLLESRFGKLTPYEGEALGNGPCRYYEAEGFSGKLGFISAVSHKFCGECNRIRLTSQGYLKTCLQYTAGRDLREVIRSGATDEELKDVIRAALDEKPDGHHFLEKAKKRRYRETLYVPDRRMIMKRAAIITLSDSGYRGEREDKSGPVIREILEKEGYEITFTELLPDDRAMIAGKLQEIADSGSTDLILTYGRNRIFPEGCNSGGYRGSDRETSSGDSGGHESIQHDDHKESDVKPRNGGNPGNYPDHQSSWQPKSGQRKPGIYYRSS